MREPQDREWPERLHEAEESQQTSGELRSWLVRGTRNFVIDPRRRAGGSGQARRLLASDATRAATAHGGWFGLVSALQRHTAHGELAKLPREDRHILTLAYLEGHTNHEIARMLEVSVRTVSRRLSIALARLDEQIRNAGIWIASIAVAALGYLRSVRGQHATNLLAAGAATAVAVTLVAVIPQVPATTFAPISPPGRSISVVPPGSLTADTVPGTPEIVTTAAITDVAKPDHKASTQPALSIAHGCGGNPTNAPPLTPVGPRTHPITGPPVTHPGKGGCGPHAEGGA